MSEPAANGVKPSPVPTTLNAQAVKLPDGSSYIALVIQTPTGTAIYFVEPSTAIEYGAGLAGMGRALLIPAASMPAQPTEPTEETCP